MTSNRLLLCAATALTTLQLQAQVVIDIDAAQRGPKISSTHYGIFFEDINHAADGGLYAELIRNRSFEDGPAYGKPADMQAWSTYAPAGAELKARLIQPTKKTRLLNSKQQNALELTVKASAQAQVCLVNEGYWGINAVMGRQYRLSFWAKGKYKGGIKATLCNSDGSTVLAETDVKAVLSAKQWTKYAATLRATGNDPKAQFALVFDGQGTVQLDMVSLFPPTFKNRENGMRPDLADMLLQMKPKFMRFPGGCFVEGQISPDNAFRWERTIGPIEERSGHWNVNWGYRTTDGIGFLEYLQLAEDLGAKPLYVVNVGLWHGGLTPVDSLQPWIDETLAALEYANGPVTSKYGAMRARDGHPEPFNIEYLEIGNENNQPDPRQQSDRYYERFRLFKQQVLAKYPNMHLIGNVVAWGDDNPRWESDESVELIDEHYYRTPAWFSDRFNKYDSYSRSGAKIYVGEYAVTSGFGNLGNQHAALGEAVYMMGMENNSDVVVMNSYAPIFVNENDAKWRPDMIRFNSSRVMGTPSYYVQQLMAQNIGTQVVRVSQHNPYDLQSRTAVTPAHSRCGYATWATQASYTHHDPLPKTGRPEMIYGDWQMAAGDILQQTGDKEACLAMCNHVIDSDHYTIHCRARKDGGREGFIIVFNYTDQNNYCWVNFGGWGNTQHGIEMVCDGAKSQVATRRGSVEQGRWYDVRLQVAGDSVKAWLDRELVFDTVLRRESNAGLWSSATIDEQTGELIVKIVNTSDQMLASDLRLSHFMPAAACVTRLATDKGSNENSLEQPTAIVPTVSSLNVDGNTVGVQLPPYSLNIVRIRPRLQLGQNPVLPEFHADPEILFHDGRYYIYSTTDGAPGWGGYYFTCYSSADLKQWRYEGVCLDLKRDTRWAKGNAWAPAAVERNGKFYLYYSGDEGSRKAIGVAVSDSPAGPFRDFGQPIVNSLPKGQTHGQQIDVDVFIDDDGQAYLYWGNGYMAGARLNADMTSIDTASVTLMTPQGGSKRDYQYREAPYVFKREGKYYFLWSVDDTGDANYHVAYGTAQQPLGPIEVARQPVVLIQRPEQQIYGPAHNSVLQLPGTDEWIICYHRINPDYMNRKDGPGFHRQVCIDRLYFNADGTIVPVEPRK